MLRNVDAIMELICSVDDITPLSGDDDIYEKGVRSASALLLLLELERRYETKIPDELFVSARTPQQLLSLVVGQRET